MLEGLFISIVGMGVVFGSLTIIMFLMMGIERVFRGDEVAVDDTAVKERVEPENAIEVAAIALALNAYLKERGVQMGTSFAINNVNYQVDVGDLSRSPVAVVVNGNSYQASVNNEGLPLLKQMWPTIGVRVSNVQRERFWRSAGSPSQGGYWNRRGWTGGDRMDTNRF